MRESTWLMLAPFSNNNWTSFKSPRYVWIYIKNQFPTNVCKQAICANTNKRKSILDKLSPKVWHLWRCDWRWHLSPTRTWQLHDHHHRHLATVQNKSELIFFLKKKLRKKTKNFSARHNKRKNEKTNFIQKKQSKVVFDSCYLCDRCLRLSYAKIRQLANDHSDIQQHILSLTFDSVIILKNKIQKKRHTWKATKRGVSPNMSARSTSAPFSARIWTTFKCPCCCKTTPYYYFYLKQLL